MSEPGFAAQLAEDLSPDDLLLVLGVFRTDVERLTGSLDVAAAALDEAAFRRAAHGLAGAAGAVGAFGLEQACRQAMSGGQSLAVAVSAPLMGLTGPWWLVPVAAQVLLNLATRAEVARVFAAVSATEGAFLRYGAMLRLVEGITLDNPLLRELGGRLGSEGVRPSEAMQQFRRIVG
ncbi:MAG TPA: Hpt domain-containing protein [Polyangiaceae bacterium]|nr:Hpt domain-containing protein [Polyangiaceae bacterium]